MDTSDLEHLLSLRLIAIEEDLLAALASVLTDPAVRSWREVLNAPEHRAIVEAFPTGAEGWVAAPDDHPAQPLVREVAARAGLPSIELYTLPIADLNALAAFRYDGLGTHPAVACSPAAFALPDRLLRATLAHEAAHLQDERSYAMTVLFSVLTGVVVTRSLLPPRTVDKAVRNLTRTYEGLRRETEALADATAAAMLDDPLSVADALVAMFERSRLRFFLGEDRRHPSVEVRCNTMRRLAGVPEQDLFVPRNPVEWALTLRRRWGGRCA